MTYEERDKKVQAFLKDLRKLVWKHVGKDFAEVDAKLLMRMQEGSSLYQPWMWPSDEEFK
jgi:hypothetical protein